jgi:hypothetical protein
VIITNKIAPVAMVFPNKAKDSIPAESLSLIMPEPTIVPNKKEVPINSAMFFLYVIQFFLFCFSSLLTLYPIIEVYLFCLLISKFYLKKRHK